MRRSAHLNTFLLLTAALFTSCLTSPLTSDGDTLSATPDQGNAGSSFLLSWLWGLMWGDDSTVTVVDRTPALTFNARPAAFGPISDVLGYLIRVEDFSVPCNDGGENGIHPHGSAGWLLGSGRAGVDDPTYKDISARDARHGCPRLCVHGPHEPQSSETWIALVMRGGCPFVDKVRQAQNFGAKGVVVGGETFEQDAHGDGLVQMYSIGDSSNVTIPSTYITHGSYVTLSSLIASSNTSIWGLNTVSVGIVSDPSGWEWYSPLLTFLLLLFLPSSLTLFTLLIHRIRAARAARRERAPETTVLKLPWRIWEGRETLWELEKSFENPQDVKVGQSSLEQAENAQEASLEEPEPSTSQPRESQEDLEVLAATEEVRKWYETQLECAICLEDFTKGDKVRILPCRHIFHMDEVDDWLIHRRKLCPICKHDVTRPVIQPSRRSSLQSLANATTSFPADMHSESTTDAAPTERTPLLQ